MTKGNGIAAIFAAILFVTPGCAAAQNVWEDIQTLNDPGSPGMKIAAANRLAELGKTDQWPHVIVALTRQAQSGDPPVRDAAVVYVNGRRAGSVWSPPYSVDVSGLLTPGENNLRVEVGNLAVNYMAGHALPDYKLLNLRYGVRFEAQDMDKIQALPSGLLGPIRLIAEAKESH